MEYIFAGSKIKALRAKTCTYIKTPVRGEEPVFVVTGRKEDVAAAKQEILSSAEHFSQIRASRLCDSTTVGSRPEMVGLPSQDVLGQLTIQVRVPFRVVGLVVGPKGATIKRIQQDSQTYIVTPSRDREPIFEVTGLSENVEKARQEIESYIALRTGTVLTDFSLNSNNTSMQLVRPLGNGPMSPKDMFSKEIDNASLLKSDSFVLHDNALNQTLRGALPLDLTIEGTRFSELFGYSGKKGIDFGSSSVHRNEFNSCDVEKLPLNKMNVSSNGSHLSDIWSHPNKSDHTFMPPPSIPEEFSSPFSSLDNNCPSQIHRRTFRDPRMQPLDIITTDNSSLQSLLGNLYLNDFDRINDLNVFHGKLARDANYPIAVLSGSVGSASDSSSMSPAESNGSVGRHQRCYVCSEADVVAAFVPCGHRYFCMECARSVFDRPEMDRRCPICHEMVSLAV